MSSLIRTKGTIVHVSKRLYKFNSRNDLVGKAVYGLAKNQIKDGLKVAVVIPESSTIISKELKPVEKLKECIKYNIDGIPVYNVLRPQQLYLIEGAGKNDFSRAFWLLIKNKSIAKKVALIHAHEEMISAFMTHIEQSESDIKTIVTPYIFSKIGFMEKIGINLADAILTWNTSDFKTFIEKTKESFYRYISDPRKLYLLDVPSIRYSQLPISDRVMKNIYESYLNTIYSTGYDYSLNIAKNKLAPNTLLINITEYGREQLNKRAKVVSEELSTIANQADIKVIPRGNVIDVKGYKGTMGGVIQMFKMISESCKGMNELNYAILGGGRGSRLSVVNLASGGIKGGVRILGKTLNEVAIKQSSILAQQLPNSGRNWTILSACDNVLIPYGPITIGNKLLENAKQKIVIFAKKIKIRSAHRSEVNYLRNLVTILADSKDGSLKEIYVGKKNPDNKNEYDLDFMLSRLNKLGGDEVYKATYYFAMSNDIVHLINDAYSLPTYKDGKPFYETYALDFELDFIEAMGVTKEEWMDRYSIRNIRRGKQITHIYDIEDWSYLWDAANQIKQHSNGIGIASLDEDTIWADAGTLKEYVRITLDIVRNRHNSNPLRKLFDISERADIEDSYIKGVQLPPREDTARGIYNPFYIKHSVFKKGGKVGKDCIIIDSIFEEKVDIPDNTIIIGSHIYKTDKRTNSERQDKLIYMLHPYDDYILRFTGGLAQATIYKTDGYPGIGSVPIRIDFNEPKDVNGRFDKDPVYGFYVLDGKISHQKIVGINESFIDLRQKVSLKAASEAYNKLRSEIDEYLGKKKYK